MATQTQTVSKPGFRESRVHDHIYDPHYTVSGSQDYDAANKRAQNANTNIKRQPIYGTMFSDLKQYPRLQLVPNTVDPIPSFMLPQQTSTMSQSNLLEDPQVSGANRYKYFKRPLISVVNSSMTPAILDADRKSSKLWRAGGPNIGESVRDLSAARRRSVSAVPDLQRQQLQYLPETFKPWRTIQTQTDYRESEAQTDPYSPEYVVKPGTQPEVLSLANLSHGRGLPAGLAEVEMIERIREKRDWELSLPPINDISQHARRRKLMEQQELKEWAYREQEIEKLQEEKLQLLLKLLKQREEQGQLKASQQQEKLWSQKQEAKLEKVDKLGHDYKRELRKLSAKREKVEGKLEKTTLSEQYGDFSSQAYAPLTRIGVFIDRNANKYAVQDSMINSYSGKVTIGPNVQNVLPRPIKAPERRTTTSAGFTRRKYREEGKLNEIYETIKQRKLQQDERVKPLRFLEKIERPPPRPVTPSVEGFSPQEEEVEIAVTILQSILRGRSIQNSMFEGITKRHDLLQELRSTHALHESSQQTIFEQKMETLQQQQKQSAQERLDSDISGTLSSLEGSTVGETLDFLAKELVRLQEERRIHAYSLLAERVRRMREAEESGLRQVEERRRREIDEIFRQVAKVHQTSVDEYLQDILHVSVTEVATEQARYDMENAAQFINETAVEAEKRRTQLESEEIVAELVHNFLLPEARRQAIKENVRKQQKKFLIAAHEEIYGLRDQLYSIEPEVKPSIVSKEFARDSSNISARRPDNEIVTDIKDSKIDNVATKSSISVQSFGGSGSERNSYMEEFDETIQEQTSNELLIVNDDKFMEDMKPSEDVAEPDDTEMNAEFKAPATSKIVTSPRSERSGASKKSNKSITEADRLGTPLHQSGAQSRPTSSKEKPEEVINPSSNFSRASSIVGSVAMGLEDEDEINSSRSDRDGGNN